MKSTCETCKWRKITAFDMMLGIFGADSPGACTHEAFAQMMSDGWTARPSCLFAYDLCRGRKWEATS